jgi:FMN reductase
MVGGSIAHLLAIEFSLKPIIHNLKGVSTQGVYFEDSSIDKENSGNPIKETDCEFRLQSQLEELINAIVEKQRATQLVGNFR